MPFGSISSGSEAAPSCPECKDFKERVQFFRPGSNLNCPYCSLAVLVCQKLFSVELDSALLHERQGNVTTMECTYLGSNKTGISHLSCTLDFSSDVSIRLDKESKR
jgi:hypothetical protein